jgi:aryl-alcohol dehydrogenase-like predicted oxidoreductase
MNYAHRAPIRAFTDYLTLGSSGLRVSPLCLGTMTFGEEVPFGSDGKTAELILDRYMERGGNFIDTANVYANGHAEQIIGAYLAHTPGKRHRAVVATKFFGNMYYADPNGGGANRKSLLRACEESLRRLQSDYIDLYWLHAWDRQTPIDETLRALDDLVRAGKVRYIGFSDTPAWKIAQARTLTNERGLSPVIAVQVEYSLLERTSEAELLPMANELGLSITAWGPLKSGALTGRHTRESVAKHKPQRGNFLTTAFTEHNFTIIDTLIAIAKELNTTPTRVALAWLLHRPGITIPIIGARTLEQLEHNLGACEVVLNADQLQRLDQISAPPPTFLSVFPYLARSMMYGGMTVNGDAAPPFMMGPRPDVAPR